MANPPNLDHVFPGQREEQPVVAHPQPQFLGIALE
jgi:hypothetical protein